MPIYNRDRTKQFQHQLGEYDKQERKWEHELEMVNKEFHKQFTNFQYLYLEKVLPNQPCE